MTRAQGSRFSASLALALALVPACSPSTSAGDAATLDAPAADAPTHDAPADATARDARSADAADPDAQGEDAATTDASLPRDGDYGSCGYTVRTCVCGCATNATCQQTCIAADEDCGFCIYEAAAACCAAENDAYAQCLERFDCNDQACVDTNCAREQSAFNLCVTRRQGSDLACMRAFRGCLGPDFPALRCAG